MGKLTEAQRSALNRMVESYGTESVRFQTGEALRRRGFAERYTQTITEAVYVTETTVTHQSWPPSNRHEWYITTAGIRALQSSEDVK